MKKHKISWEEIYLKIKTMKNALNKNTDKIYGIPRGGQIVAGLTGMAVDTPEDATIIIDDLYDSGATYNKWVEKYPDKEFVFLFNKQFEYQNTWLQFPWEESGEKEVEENVIRLLEYFGEDASREGLKETPKRYVKFFKQFLSPPEFNCTTFESEGYDEMIVQTNIPFHSLCEHHIAPFFGIGAIAYIPNKKIIGLSKLARTLDQFSRRLQNQERITIQVAEFLQNELDPQGVAVVLKAKHMCMEMRGVKKHDTWTTTSKMIGVFKDNEITRNEFLSLIK